MFATVVRMKRYKDFKVLVGYKFVSETNGSVEYVGIILVDGKEYMVDDYYFFGMMQSTTTVMVRRKDVRANKQRFIGMGYKLINQMDMLINGKLNFGVIDDYHIEVDSGVWYLVTNVGYGDKEYTVAHDYIDAVEKLHIKRAERDKRIGRAQ